MERVYLDSCIVIYLHEASREVQERIWSAMRSAHATVFHVSDLVGFECRVGALKRRDAALLSEYDAFFGLPEIANVTIDRNVFRLGAEIRAADGLKTPDALHVAAAIEAGCSAIWTHDEDLLRASHRIRVEQILI
jgi:predicted nucleic acid-binding protein